MKLKAKLLIFLLLLITSTLFSQKNTFSPYSRYGLGELAHHGFTTNLGLGGTNAGIRIPNQINYLNPASYTTQDTNSFIFDIGLQGSANLMKMENSQTNKSTAGFDYLSIGFPVSRWWNASIGIVPYSHVGYTMKTENQYEDGIRRNFYEGSGGLQKFYVGNAFKVTENLSLGLNYSYLFGKLRYTSEMAWQLSDTNQVRPLSFIKYSEKIIRASQFNFGFQYSFNFGENSSLTLGGSYEKTVNFDFQEKRFAYSQEDSLSFTSNPNSTFPDNYSLGASFSNEKILLGIDMNYTEWSRFNDDRLNDSYSLHTGFQLTPDKNALRSYLKRVDYRLGAYYKNGYLSIKNNNINDFGITFGLGLPLKYRKTKFNLAVLVGRKGTIDNNLIEHDYVIVNFGITFYDYWFIERKYQ